MSQVSDVPKAVRCFTCNKEYGRLYGWEGKKIYLCDTCFLDEKREKEWLRDNWEGYTNDDNQDP